MTCAKRLRVAGGPAPHNVLPGRKKNIHLGDMAFRGQRAGGAFRPSSQLRDVRRMQGSPRCDLLLPRGAQHFVSLPLVDEQGMRHTTLLSNQFLHPPRTARAGVA